MPTYEDITDEDALKSAFDVCQINLDHSYKVKHDFDKENSQQDKDAAQARADVCRIVMAELRTAPSLRDAEGHSNEHMMSGYARLDSTADVDKILRDVSGGLRKTGDTYWGLVSSIADWIERNVEKYKRE